MPWLSLFDLVRFGALLVVKHYRSPTSWFAHAWDCQSEGRWGGNVMDQQNDCVTQERKTSAHDVPSVRTLSSPYPQAQQAGGDVDVAVGREHPPGERDVDAGRQERERRQGQQAR